MVRKVTHEGDRRHTNHGKYLQVLGELTFWTAYLTERTYQVVIASPAPNARKPRRGTRLGTLTRHLERSARAHRGRTVLSDLLRRIESVANARNDVFHAIALTGGAFRFAEPGQTSRTYFAIAELETVRDDLRAAGELADDILGRARLPLPPYSAEQREYYRAIGRVIYEYHWLFTCLVDVLRNLGDHHERDLRLREMQYLLNRLEEVIEQRSGDKSEELLRELSRRTRTANSQRNRVVHAVPDDGNPFKLAATTPQQPFDVGNQQVLDQLGTELIRLWHLADRIVKAQESPLPSYMQGIPLRRIDL